MNAKKTYQVTATREPGWWIIEVPSLDAVVTQARRLSDVERNAREAIAVWLDIDIDSFELETQVVVPQHVLDEFERSKSILALATEQQQEAASVASQAIRRLTDDLGLTVREAGQVMGISYQRVAQLAGKPAKKIPPKVKARQPKAVA
jgi:predicted RNase H-like HicB family nuclease